MRSSDSGDNPRLKWGPWQENVEKVLEASGGFEGCSNQDVINYLRQLCERSLEQWTEEDSVVLERASNSVVFSCEVRSDVTFVQWRLDDSTDGDIKCQPGPRKAAMKAEPAFVFNKKGKIEAIEFWARNGTRQSVNTTNCRHKLKLSRKRNVNFNSADAVDKMPRLKSDPQDFVMANRICFEYTRPPNLEKSE